MGRSGFLSPYAFLLCAQTVPVILGHLPQQVLSTLEGGRAQFSSPPRKTLNLHKGEAGEEHSVFAEEPNPGILW